MRIAVNAERGRYWVHIQRERETVKGSGRKEDVKDEEKINKKGRNSLACTCQHGKNLDGSERI
jgi:hypothetical protein